MHILGLITLMMKPSGKPFTPFLISNADLIICIFRMRST